MAAAPRPAHGVDPHGEATRSNPLDIDDRQLEHTLEVPLDRRGIRTDPSPCPSTARESFRISPSPACSRVVVRQRANARAGVPIKKDAVRPDEFEGVPLDRLVARLGRAAATPMLVLD